MDHGDVPDLHGGLRTHGGEYLEVVLYIRLAGLVVALHDKPDGLLVRHKGRAQYGAGPGEQAGKERSRRVA